MEIGDLDFGICVFGWMQWRSEGDGKEIGGVGVLHVLYTLCLP